MHNGVTTVTSSRAHDKVHAAVGSNDIAHAPNLEPEGGILKSSLNRQRRIFILIGTDYDRNGRRRKEKNER